VTLEPPWTTLAPQEAAAAHSIASRGIALIATAHGTTLSDLLRNPDLSKLVGGVQPVTVGDAEARTSRNGAKVRLERKGAAMFKYLLELRGKGTWRLHPDLEARCASASEVLGCTGLRVCSLTGG